MRPHRRQATRLPVPGILQARTLTIIRVWEYLTTFSTLEQGNMKHLAPKDVFLCHILRQLTQAFSITWMKHLSSVYIHLYSHTQKWLHRWPEYFCHRKECPLRKSINYHSDSSWSPQLFEFNCHESATMSSNLGQVHSEKIQFLSLQSEASILTKSFLPQYSLVLGSRAGYHRICLNAIMITLNWSSMKNSWWEKIF